MLSDLYHGSRPDVISYVMTLLLWQPHCLLHQKESVLSLFFFYNSIKFISQVLQEENTQVLSTVLCVVKICSQSASVVLCPSER